MKEKAARHQVGTPQSDKALLQFLGDISLNGSFCDPSCQRVLTRDVNELAGRLGRCHLRIGNWESPLWGDGGVNVMKQPRLFTTEDAAKSILSLGLDVALLANNHIYDCLEKGFENTLQFLDSNGIHYLGAGINKTKASEPLVLTQNGWRFGLLNYVGLETNPSIPAGAGVFLNIIKEERLLAEVASLATQVDIVVLNLHWGMELVKYPSLEQRRLARRAIEAGARIVACHHSHCLQGHESWRDGHIFYSLGN
ncbi:MAG TPA: CapA family protein, partial [Desulfatiglandales bacterium]|nr:CapA family protein [Desulfatiglandales bacterium]